MLQPSLSKTFLLNVITIIIIASPLSYAAVAPVRLINANETQGFSGSVDAGVGVIYYAYVLQNTPKTTNLQISLSPIQPQSDVTLMASTCQLPNIYNFIPIVTYQATEECTVKNETACSIVMPTFCELKYRDKGLVFIAVISLTNVEFTLQITEIPLNVTPFPVDAFLSDVALQKNQKLVYSLPTTNNTLYLDLTGQLIDKDSEITFHLSETADGNICRVGSTLLSQTTPSLADLTICPSSYSPINDYYAIVKEESGNDVNFNINTLVTNTIIYKNLTTGLNRTDTVLLGKTDYWKATLNKTESRTSLTIKFQNNNLNDTSHLSISSTSMSSLSCSQSNKSCTGTELCELTINLCELFSDSSSISEDFIVAVKGISSHEGWNKTNGITYTISLILSEEINYENAVDLELDEINSLNVTKDLIYLFKVNDTILSDLAEYLYVDLNILGDLTNLISGEIEISRDIPEFKSCLDLSKDSIIINQGINESQNFYLFKSLFCKSSIFGGNLGGIGDIFIKIKFNGSISLNITVSTIITNPIINSSIPSLDYLEPNKPNIYQLTIKSGSNFTIHFTDISVEGEGNFFDNTHIQIYKEGAGCTSPIDVDIECEFETECKAIVRKSTCDQLWYLYILSNLEISYYIHINQTLYALPVEFGYIQTQTYSLLDEPLISYYFDITSYTSIGIESYATGGPYTIELINSNCVSKKQKCDGGTFEGPCLLLILTERELVLGRYYIRIVYNSGSLPSIDAAVTVRLGTDNCVESNFTSNHFCYNISGITSLSMPGPLLLSVDTNDNIAHVTYNAVSVLPGVTEECKAHFHIYICSIVFLQCGSNGIVPIPRRLCDSCQGLVSNCVNATVCLEPLFCDLVCLLAEPVQSPSLSPAVSSVPPVSSEDGSESESLDDNSSSHLSLWFITVKSYILHLSS